MTRKILPLIILALLIQSPVLAWTSPETVTVMVYMCGSDLETRGGSASNDIIEMMAADYSDSLNVVIETGGAKQWHLKGLKGGASQRHIITRDSLDLLETSAARDMTDPKSLTSFIKFCAKNYPADRYCLVMWDHGGGSLYGFGSDENFAGCSLSLAEIRQALADAGVHFEFVGFDACLMGSLETAIAVAPYADYLVASEEIEPGSGWEFTSWLSALAREPGMDARELGEVIVDGYIYSVSDGETEGTLSVIDLKAASESAMEAVGLFAREASGLITSSEFARLSRAREGAKSFGYKQHEMVDLADFAARSGVESEAEIIDGLSRAVVYSSDTGNMRSVGGLSIYFPYNDPDSLDKMLEIYADIGFNAAYSELVKSYVEVRRNGQAMITSDETPLSGSGGGAFDASAGWSDSGWAQTALDLISYIGSHYIAEDSLVLSEKGGGYALQLSDSEWDLIVNTQLNVFMDDGEGYIDLGLDDTVDYDADGDLIADFDYEWVALNGQTVAFYSGDYSERDGRFRYTGYVPALINGVDSEIVLAWDSEHDSGYVVGAREAFSAQSALTRGLSKLRQGDVISPLCDYYNYDGSFSDAFILGDDITVNGDIFVTYEDIGDADTLISFLLTDIYGNTYWTESVSYE